MDRQTSAADETRISAERLLTGALDFFDSAILPHLGTNPTVKVLAQTGAAYLRNNSALQDKLLGNPVLQTVLGFDGRSGTWAPDGFLSELEKSVAAEGLVAINIQIPRVPFLDFCADKVVVSFTKSDIEALRRNIYSRSPAAEKT